MLTSIPISEELDPRLLDFTFSDQGKEFLLFFTYKTTQETDANREALKHFLRAAQGTDPVVQNFIIDFSDKKTIKIKGNLFNALNMLKNNQFISEELHQSVNKNIVLKQFINDSIKGNSTSFEETKDEASQNKAAGTSKMVPALKSIFEIYSTLDAPHQQQLLLDLTKGFSTLGVKLTIDIGTLQQQTTNSKPPNKLF